MYKSPGVVVRFMHSGDGIGTALEAIEALLPVVRPLALELRTGCYFGGTQTIDSQVYPENSEFYFRESSGPPGVTIHAVEGPEDNQRITSHLTIAAIRDWCATALREPAPDADHVVVLEQMWCNFSLARCYTPDLTLIDTGGNSWPVPVIARDGVLWAPGPLDCRPMDAPLSYNIKNIDGGLRLDVQMGWDLWHTPGHPEHELLRHRLAALQPSGWKSEDS